MVLDYPKSDAGSSSLSFCSCSSEGVLVALDRDYTVSVFHIEAADPLTFGSTHGRRPRRCLGLSRVVLMSRRAQI